MIKKDNETYGEMLKRMFSLKEDAASHEEIRERLISGGQITGTNLFVLICAMVIASVGLNVSSTAVIIGVLKTPKVRELTEAQWKKLRRKMIRNTIIVLVPSLILGYLMIKG